MIWKACALFGVKPPGVKDKWEDCDVWTQALMLAFTQTSDHDNYEAEAAEAGVLK